MGKVGKIAKKINQVDLRSKNNGSYYNQAEQDYDMDFDDEEEYENSNL